MKLNAKKEVSPSWSLKSYVVYAVDVSMVGNFFKYPLCLSLKSMLLLAPRISNSTKIVIDSKRGNA